MRSASLLLAFLWLSLVTLPGAAAPSAAAPAPYSAEQAEGMSAEARRLAAQRHLELTPPDLVEARLWLESAAAEGSVEAMGAVGWLYEQGLGVEPDAEQALRYFTQAYDAGENEYGLRIAWMHIQGRGVEPDRDLGEAWFQRVIDERDDHEARLALGSLLVMDASLVVTDAHSPTSPDRVAEARDLLVHAVENGMVAAAYYLARIYREGLGSVAANPMQDLYYTRLGAEAGHPQMQAWLAHFHAVGNGVPLDAIEAYKWASLAAAGGDATSEPLRQNLESQLNPAELTEARRRALLWLNAPE